MVGPITLSQRVAANAPLHQGVGDSLSLVTRQRTRRPHVAGAPAATAIIIIIIIIIIIGIATHLRVESRERVVLAEGELGVVLMRCGGGGVVHWRRRRCIRGRREMAEGVGGA